MYQAKNLPASDSNGLADPYVVVHCLGKEAHTTTKYKTLYPQFHEVLVFDDVQLASYDNFHFAPGVNFHCYDKDLFDQDDFMGTCTLHMDSAVVTEDPAQEITQDPVWRPLFRDKPGDTTGELLVMIQLVPLIDSRGQPVPKSVLAIKPRSIVPASRLAYIEVVAIGLRGLAPFNFEPIQQPYMEFELSSVGTQYHQTTK